MIETERLRLRPWTLEDLPKMMNLCGNKLVMRYFPSRLDAEKSAELLDILIRHQADHGFTYFLAEELESKAFLGFIGLKYQTFESHFTPCIDIGWRLLPHAWGKGYATEGATACLKFAFKTLKLDQVYAMCPSENTASEKVMQRIGMHKSGSFHHPAIPEESGLNPCALYLIESADWRK